MGAARVVRADDVGAVAAVVGALRAGSVVVVPTDTVYGLAAVPDCAAAVQAVYDAKGRPDGMHLPVLAASVAQVRDLGVDMTEGADALAAAWWPGPLTLALGFAGDGDGDGAGDGDATRPSWLDGREEVAVRIPDHDFVRAVLDETGPLLVTSANPHGAPTPRRASDVSTGLGAMVDLLVDGGTLTEVPSTLVVVSGAGAVVQREGAITTAEIDAVLAAAVAAAAAAAVAAAAAAGEGQLP